MNYEQKHQKDLEAANGWLAIAKENNNTIAIQILEKFFPELKESEDEKIRKEIYRYFRDLQLSSDREFSPSISIDEILAWLEKQGNQDNNEDVDILQRFSFYSYKDEPNVLYLSGLYVNEEYRNKGIGTKILKIADKVSTNMECNYIRLKTESGGDAERLYKENGYNTLKKEGNQVWLEKQGKQKPIDMIEPKFKPGDKIVEKDIYECGSGTIKEIKDGKYIFEDNCFIYIQEQDLWQLVKEPVEPKFKIGDWVQIDGGHLMKILEVKKDVLCYRILNWCGNESVRKISDIDSIAHLWTIQDAKDGDVLVYPDGTIVIFKYKLDGLNSGIYMSHILLATKIEISQSCAVSKDITPAAKEQRDLLFQKMKEAGYEWNAEKKELKKIEQKLSCSEEDEKMIDTIIYDLERHGGKEDSSYLAEINWLKELKERVQPHPKQEWNKEDSERLNRIYKFIWANRKGDTDEIYQQEQDANWLMTLKPQPEQEWSVEDDYVYNEILKRVANKKLYEHDLEYIYTWLKSLKSQNRWKPSDEQLKTLWNAIIYVEGCHSNFRGGCMLESLYKDLKKL